MAETSYIPKRLIYFKGHDNQDSSALITRVCKNYETISDILSGECATRTLLNLYNLHTVRGCLQNNILNLDSSMSGPHHYFGFIFPTNYHIIKFDTITGYPNYYKVDSQTANLEILKQNKFLKKIPENKIIKFNKYKWISGKIYKNIINTNNGQIQSQKDSLFENPGVLYLEKEHLQFNVINNAIDIDLSSFRAQIVDNNKPFIFNQSLVQQYKHAQHKLRIITYNYGSNYVDNYLIPDSGIFIERHEFIQAITPMNSDCTGFVILGRINNINYSLELIAVCIPFGFTLLVEPWAIHGDSLLNGMYMMAMTGNHEAMQTADTIFLKTVSGKNIIVSDYEFSNKKIIPKAYDILMTSDKMPIQTLKKYDEILKKNINSTINKINPIMNLFWKPVITTGTYLIGWRKTLGCYLP